MDKDFAQLQDARAARDFPFSCSSKDLKDMDGAARSSLDILSYTNWFAAESGIITTIIPRLRRNVRSHCNVQHLTGQETLGRVISPRQHHLQLGATHPLGAGVEAPGFFVAPERDLGSFDSNQIVQFTQPYDLEMPLDLETDFEFILPVSQSPVGGRLAQYVENWTQITSDSWILSVIEKGYMLPWESLPPVTYQPVGRRFFLQGDRLAGAVTAIQQLLDKQAIVEIPPSDQSCGFYSPVFLVPKKDTEEKRMIIDLKVLNKEYLRKPPKFKMESLTNLRTLIQPNSKFISIDLKDAYLHVPIHPRSQKYLRFAVNGRRFQFRVLPFGISLAPWLFTVIINPILAFLHHRQIAIHGYLDDFLARNIITQTLLKQTKFILHVFTHLGLVVHPVKSELVPTSKIKYLGAILDAKTARIFTPQDRWYKIRTKIFNLLASKAASIRTWMSLLGSLTSIQDFTMRGRIHLREPQIWINGFRDLDLETMVSPPFMIRQEFLWWTVDSNVLPGVHFRLPPPDVTLYADASNSGWGAHVNEHQVQGLWSQQESNLHINCLEMLALVKALSHWSWNLHQKNIMLVTDNSTVVAYINKQGGTKSHRLLQITKELFKIADSMKSHIKARHIPGKVNILADSLSRQDRVISTEWTLNMEAFKLIKEKWETPSIDLFATARNNRLPTFVSPVPDPTAWAVDALSISWENLIAYAFPPFKLIPEVLAKIAQHNCVVYLVAPAWPTRTWFTDLLQLLTDKPLRLPCWENLLSQPKSDRYHKNVNLLALHVWRLSIVPSRSRVSMNKQFRLSPSLSDLQRQHCMTPSGMSSSSGEESNDYSIFQSPYLS
ncbi:uncharacterized protein LOC124255024 [Haliotis rubra]|uniref:uncharacterized protein LOC124255024 n=1 Tax=Haliotis rubra TaxID=36100 RepID=UPI001EE626A1|nr:uncharacterized protein LOC124255024 [Haliotis rubra]